MRKSEERVIYEQILDLFVEGYQDKAWELFKKYRNDFLFITDRKSFDLHFKKYEQYLTASFYALFKMGLLFTSWQVLLLNSLMLFFSLTIIVTTNDSSYLSLYVPIVVLHVISFPIFMIIKAVKWSDLMIYDEEFKTNPFL